MNALRVMPRCQHCGWLCVVLTASELLTTSPPAAVVAGILELRDLVGPAGRLTVCTNCGCITTLEPVAGHHH